MKLFARRSIYLGIVGIIELLQEHTVVSERVDDFFGLGNGASHALGGGSQDDLSSKGFEEDTAFHTHTLGHGKNELISPSSSDHGQSDSSISTRRFDEDGLSGSDISSLFCFRNHTVGDTILD